MRPEFFDGLFLCRPWYLVRCSPAFAHEEFGYTSQGSSYLRETTAEHAVIFIGGLPMLGRRTNQAAKAINPSEDGRAKPNMTREPSRVASDNVKRRFWRAITSGEVVFVPAPVEPDCGV